MGMIWGNSINWIEKYYHIVTMTPIFFNSSILIFAFFSLMILFWVRLIIFNWFIEPLKRIISSRMSSVSWLYDKLIFAQFPKYVNKFIIPKFVNLFFDAFKLCIFLCSSAVEITCSTSSSERLHPVMSKVSLELLN